MDQMAFGIGKDVTLAPFDHFARTIAPRPASLGGFHALAIDCTGAGRDSRACASRTAISRVWFSVSHRPLPVTGRTSAARSRSAENEAATFAMANLTEATARADGIVVAPPRLNQLANGPALS